MLAPDHAKARPGVPARWRRVAALLHTGNESNMRKLLLGHGWGTESDFGILDSSKWDAFRERMIRERTLTKADFDFVQGTWDMFARLLPLVQSAYRDRRGADFEVAPNIPIGTPWGIYSGGFVPARIERQEPIGASTASIDGLHASLQHAEADFVRSLPRRRRGFKSAVPEKLVLDLGAIPQQLDEWLRFGHLHRALVDRVALLRSPELMNAMQGMESCPLETLFIPWLDRLINPRAVTTCSCGRGLFGKMGRWLFGSGTAPS